MNGTLAQFVALTCHANAFLQGRTVPEFFPGNSTCQFCDFVKFFKVSKTFFGKTQETQLAPNPNDWFEYLKSQRTRGVRLSCTPQNRPEIPDRMSAAFVGGGGTWAVASIHQNGRSNVWLSRWEVWNQNAPERRIWRVSYGCVSKTRSGPAQVVDLESLNARFRSALEDIHAFSKKHNCGGFTACFARAIETLDSLGATRSGYHKDLAPAGVLPELAIYLLDACQSAWVFGGMGSWNDMGFDGKDQVEYDRVSEQLFTALNETIQSAANASCVASI
jgi:hypothetical protein